MINDRDEHQPLDRGLLDRGGGPARMADDDQAPWLRPADERGGPDQDEDAPDEDMPEDDLEPWRKDDGGRSD